MRACGPSCMLVLSKSRVCGVSCRIVLSFRGTGSTSIAVTTVPIPVRRTDHFKVMIASRSDEVGRFRRGPRGPDDGLTSVKVCVFD